MKSKEALQTISQKLEQGQSKQEIYSDLLSKVLFKSDLVHYLAMVPSHEDRVKYRTLNIVLFSLLIFIFLSKLVVVATSLGSISPFAQPVTVFVLGIMTCVSAAIYFAFAIYFALGVWKFRGYIYRILGLLGFFSLLKGFASYDDIFAVSLLDLIVYVPTILIIVLAYYIGFKVFPYYGFWGTLNENKLRLTAEPAGALDCHSATLPGNK